VLGRVGDRRHPVSVVVAVVGLVLVGILSRRDAASQMVGGLGEAVVQKTC
jgi:hypothetical protein